MEKTIFLNIFGDTPKLRLLDFLVTYSELDYSMTDIAEKSGIGYSTLKLFWPQILKEKTVVHTRDIGKAKLYKLNKQSKFVKRFNKFYWDVTWDYTEKKHNIGKYKKLAA